MKERRKKEERKKERVKMEFGRGSTRSHSVEEAVDLVRQTAERVNE